MLFPAMTENTGELVLIKNYILQKSSYQKLSFQLRRGYFIIKLLNKHVTFINKPEMEIEKIPKR